MTRKKSRGFVALLEIYTVILSEAAGEDGVEHLEWMVKELRREWPRNSWHPEKKQRWLGFIQGWLWTRGFVTVEDLREQTNAAIDDEAAVLRERPRVS